MTGTPDVLELNSYGLYIINFRNIFHDSYKFIVDDLFEYEIYHDLNIRKQDTKKIYYYHMIKQLCDTVLSIKTNNKIVIYYSAKDIKCDFKHCKNKQSRNGKVKDVRSEFVLFMSRFFKQLRSILPLKMYICDVKFETFIQYYNTNKGKYLEMINGMRGLKQKPNYDFERLKKFTDKYKLVYLTNEYFNQVKVRSIMYK